MQHRNLERVSKLYWFPGRFCGRVEKTHLSRMATPYPSKDNRPTGDREERDKDATSGR